MASALASLKAHFDALHMEEGRLSIAPERLIRASLLQMLFSIRVTPAACFQHDASAPAAPCFATPWGVVPTQPALSQTSSSRFPSKWSRGPFADPSNSSTQARQPVLGGRRSQAPSVRSATFRSQPAQSPVAPEATM
jgi:hypothetical protein